MLKLTDLVADGAILPALVANERDAVVRELVNAAVASGKVPQPIAQDLIRLVLEREKRGSTGFGRGVAVPHVKHPAIQSMTAAVGLSATGIEFASLDRAPVFTVFLLISPQDRPEDHLKAMEVIFKNLSKDAFRRQLRQAQTVADVRSILADADAQHLVA